MAYVMSLNASVSDLGGQNALATVRSGSNGYAWGDSEYLVGTSGDDTTDGRSSWDSNLSNGFDTLSLPTQIDASSAGTSLAVSGADDGELFSSDAAITGVGSVYLRAVAMSANSEAIWSGITVEFYKNHQLIQSFSIPTLDASGTSSSPTQEDLAVVTPSASDNDEVIITGAVRLLSGGTSRPATDQMFCQALIC